MAIVRPMINRQQSGPRRPTHETPDLGRFRREVAEYLQVEVCRTYGIPGQFERFVKFVTCKGYLSRTTLNRSKIAMTARRVTSERVAVITGASRGLGRVIAGFLAKQGFALIVTAREEAALRSAADEFAAAGADIVSIPGDVRDPDDRLRLIDAAERSGRLDLLVNNASDLGESPLPPLEKASRETFRRVLEVNTVAPLSLVQEALPLLIRSRGLVVNITSDAAVGGYPGWGVYGASKAALDLLSKTLAEELRDRGVAVVSVDPGDLRTKMHQDAYPGQDISDRPLPEVTLPFWGWLFSQDPMKISGMRYQVQAALWRVPA